MNKCCHCGLVIADNRKYCDDKCKEKHRYLRNIQLKPCSVCGNEFQTTKGTKTCSPECKLKSQKIYKKKCLVCNTEFDARGNGLYCSDLCYRTANSNTKGLTVATCEVCHADFKMLKTEPRETCSDKCSAKLFTTYISRSNREVFGVNNKKEITRIISEGRFPVCKENQVKILR